MADREERFVHAEHKKLEFYTSFSNFGVFTEESLEVLLRYLMGFGLYTYSLHSHSINYYLSLFKIKSDRRVDKNEDWAWPHGKGSLGFTAENIINVSWRLRIENRIKDKLWHTLGKPVENIHHLMNYHLRDKRLKPLKTTTDEMFIEYREGL